MLKDQEDSDQREHLTLDPLSFSERLMMLESTLSLETIIEKPASTEKKKHSTNHQRSKDLLLRRELEERFSTRDLELMLGRRTRKLTLLMKSFSPNILRKRKLLRRLPTQLQLQNQRLKKRRSQLQLRPKRKLQPRRKRKPQPREKLRKKLLHQRKRRRKLKRREEKERSELSLIQQPHFDL